MNPPDVTSLRAVGRGRPRVPGRSARGFTTIELITTLVIIGVLAALALPKFFDLTADSRQAAVISLTGSIQSAAATGMAACAVSTTCALTMRSTDLPFVTIQGKWVQFSFGNPTPYSPGIDTMVNLKGFTVQPYVPASKKAIFTLDSAPDPTRCRVVYDTLASEVALTWVPATVTYDTSGC